MGICAWLALGGIAGWIASMITGTNARMGMLANIGVGIAGALLGGFLFHAAGGIGITGFNLYSLFVAVFGAAALLTLARALFK